MTFHLVLGILVLALLQSGVSAQTVDPDRVHFIDYAPSSGNYLFRTGLPLNSTSFAYDQMRELFSSVAKSQAHLSLPSDYLMSVLCLLSIEASQIQMESDFFQAHPELGNFTHWPIIGSLVNPVKVAPDTQKTDALSLTLVTPDDVPGKMQQLRAMLETRYQKPVVFFVHCDAGMDRTGEISGSYYMTYQNMSFAAALTLDDSINDGDLNRSILCETRNSFQWYCLHLMYTGVYSKDNCSVPAVLPPCSYLGLRLTGQRAFDSRSRSEHQGVAPIEPYAKKFDRNLIRKGSRNPL